MRTKYKKCSTKFYRNYAAKKRRKCWKCLKAEWRDRNPITAAYSRLKSKAKERGFMFCMPVWYFCLFAEKTRLVEMTGNTKTSLTVDLIENRVGYIAGNIQPLTREQNAIKFDKFDERRIRGGIHGRPDFKITQTNL